MSSQTTICVVVFLAAFGAVSGREQCNPYNFATQGGYLCSLNWWNTTNVQDKITFTPKMSVETRTVLISHNINLTSINEALKDVAFNRPDPLSKLIESALVVEPYIPYMLADVLLGFELTDSELQKLHLPSFLSNRQSLINMYTNYFKLHCSSNLLGPLVSCLTTWMNGNCDPVEDKPHTLIDWMNNVIGFYCSNGIVKATIKKDLDKDLGKVLTSALKQVGGLDKDPNSPYVFNMAFNNANLMKVAEKFQNDCIPQIDSSASELLAMGHQRSSNGIGATLEPFMKLSKPLVICSLDSVRKVVPELFDSSKPLIHHIARMGQQMGMKAEDFGVSSPAGLAGCSQLAMAVCTFVLAVSLF